MIRFKVSQERPQNLLRSSLALIFVYALAGFECAGAASITDAPVAAVFVGDWPGAKPDLARKIAGDIRAAGYATKFIGPDVLTTSTSLLSRHWDLLVLPQARSLPVGSMDAVRDFLRGSGNMMALGLPTWDSPTFGRQPKQQRDRR